MREGGRKEETLHWGLIRVSGWHHHLNRHEFEQTPVDGEGQESLECFSPWGRKELDTIE